MHLGPGTSSIEGIALLALQRLRLIVVAKTDLPLHLASVVGVDIPISLFSFGFLAACGPLLSNGLSLKASEAFSIVAAAC
jgi:hypothetical protein